MPDFTDIEKATDNLARVVNAFLRDRGWIMGVDGWTKSSHHGYTSKQALAYEEMLERPVDEEPM